MNIRSKVAAATIALVIVLGAAVGIYVYMDYGRVDYSTIDYIKKMQKGRNQFNDLGHDINVESVDDIGYIVNGYYMIDIHYGDQIITMNKKCFEDKTFREKLEGIGIKVLTHEDDDQNVQYRVTYWGDIVQEFSLIS